MVAALVGALACTAAAPAAASAQFGIAPRVGTLGLGAEGAIELSDRFVFRGGAGLSKVEISTQFSTVPVKLEFPDAWYNVGLDLYLNSVFRIGGGIAFKPDDPTLRGDYAGPVEIGGVLLTPQEVGSLTGSIDMDDQAVYALIGFGRHTAAETGLFVDFGVVVMGAPQVTLAASGGTYPQDQLDQLLATESRNFEDDMKPWLEIWPILNIGVRIGIGY